MQRVIIEYVRDKRRNPIGTVVAFVTEGNEIAVGWSRCNRKLDRFNKQTGKFIAAWNALHNHIKSDFGNLPTAYRAKILKVLDRAYRYFKQADCTPLEEGREMYEALREERTRETR